MFNSCSNATWLQICGGVTAAVIAAGMFGKSASLEAAAKSSRILPSLERLPPAWPVSIITSLESIWYCSYMFVCLTAEIRRGERPFYICLQYLLHLPVLHLGNWEALESRFWFKKTPCFRQVSRGYSLLSAGLSEFFYTFMCPGWRLRFQWAVKIEMWMKDYERQPQHVTKYACACCIHEGQMLCWQ